MTTLPPCPRCGGPQQCLTDQESDQHPVLACAEGSACPGLQSDRITALETRATALEVPADRLRFIRRHARELHLKGVVAVEYRKDCPDGSKPRGDLRGADAAWFLARKLWDAKPEDC